MTYSLYVKAKLFEIIKEAAQNLRFYCQNPDKDFTRNRKLNLEEMLCLIIMMEGGSIKKELLSYFDYNTDTATSSAFIQQRSKIKPEVFAQILLHFNNLFLGEKLYKGYRLIACDGSNLITIYNSDDTSYHYH